MTLLAKPHNVALRAQETIVWQGQPCWRTLARRVFHIRAIGLYACALVLANAVAARMQERPPIEALWAIGPVLVFGAVVVAAIAAFAWASGRTTLYTVTNQRVVMQYGIAMTATLALPMRLIASVAVSDGPCGDVPIRLKAGATVSLIKIWPHARPWRIARPEPMFRALPDAVEAAAALSHAVAAAQQAARFVAPAPASRVRSGGLEQVLGEVAAL